MALTLSLGLHLIVISVFFGNYLHYNVHVAVTFSPSVCKIYLDTPLLPVVSPTWLRDLLYRLYLNANSPLSSEPRHPLRPMTQLRSNVEGQAYPNLRPRKTHRLCFSTTLHRRVPLQNQKISRGRLRHGGSPNGCRQAKSLENAGYVFRMKQKTILHRQSGDHRVLAHSQLMKRVFLTGWLRKKTQTAGLRHERR